MSSANRSLDVLLEDSIKTIEKWQYLYWTKQESEEISSKFKKKGYKVTYKNGHEASEDFFKKYSKDSILSPNIIHVATHGFSIQISMEEKMRIMILCLNGPTIQ